MGEKIILQTIGKSIKKKQLYEESVFLKNLKFYYSWTLLLNMREKNMANRPLTNDQRSKELYRIAYQCAETKHTTGCNNNCAACPLNVHLYVDDARDATLIKTSAAMDYGKATIAMAQRNTNNKIDNVLHLIKVIFVAALLFSAVYFPVSCFKNTIHNWAVSDDEVKIEKRVLRPWIEEDSPLAPTNTYKATAEITNWILMSCMQSTEMLKQSYDSNEDGLSDCIDDALVFWAYYWLMGFDINIGDSYNEPRLIWNYNPNTNWSHLFCAVPNGYGDLLYIECTRRGDVLYQVMMPIVWGSDYNPIYNKDVTQYRIAIQDGTYIWRW
jgi:hypothetical protein